MRAGRWRLDCRVWVQDIERMMSTNSSRIEDFIKNQKTPCHVSRHPIDHVDGYATTPMMIEYTGRQDELCPITLIPFTELKHPAVILPDYSHPFELDELIHWLKIRKANPRTNEKLRWRHSAADVVGIVKSARNSDCIFDHLESNLGSCLFTQ